MDLEPLVRLVGMSLLARRFYGALIDANGASYADVDETLSRIRSLKPDAWAREWRRTAERYDGLGRRAADEGRLATATELLVRASTCYRFAEMSLLSDDGRREELQRASVAAYVLAGEFMEPPVERVLIPVGEVRVPAYLRLPAGQSRPPVVLIVPGLGMVKEHGDFPQEVVLARGMAALTVDLPGQGESRRLLALNEANGRAVVSAAIDFLAGRTDLDTGRLGLIGTSMGAAAAMLAAAEDTRVRALVEIAGFYCPSAWWEHFPAEIKEFLRYIMGAADQTELLEMIRPVSLQGHVKAITCPLLVVHGGRDQIVPFEESELIFAEATSRKERLTFPRGDHGCINVAEARSLIGDWMARELGAGARRA